MLEAAKKQNEELVENIVRYIGSEIRGKSDIATRLSLSYNIYKPTEDENIISYLIDEWVERKVLNILREMGYEVSHSR